MVVVKIKIIMNDYFFLPKIDYSVFVFYINMVTVQYIPHRYDYYSISNRVAFPYSYFAKSSVFYFLTYRRINRFK